MPTELTAKKSHRRPKNIVICSDGTANAGGTTNATNVWRIREAVADAIDDEIRPDENAPHEGDHVEQVVIYEDGVGTEGFRPMAILGGAFALGITRDLEILYGRLIRQFNPGDRIYMFGFSRGAFTIRTLANMLYRCGIADCRNKNGELRTPEEIDEIAKNAIKAYKLRHRGEDEKFRLEWGYAWPDELPQWGDADPCEDSHTTDATICCESGGCESGGCESGGCGRPANPEPGRFPIEFIGVWDTVDAVSLPFDNVTQIGMWISHATSWFGVTIAPNIMLNFRKYRFLYRELDDDLHPYIKNAYHAIALDDERETFHPVLWYEFEDGCHKCDQEFVCGGKRHIEQVWFSGVHANVGGGYGKDHLSYVSLEWMMRHALRAGLVFADERWNEYINERDVMGRMHDSRKGSAIFYRYRPRLVEEISRRYGLIAERNHKNEPDLKTFPKIHASVFDRIENSSRDYAPTGIPPFDKYVEVDNPACRTESISGPSQTDTQDRVDCHSPFFFETSQYQTDKAQNSAEKQGPKSQDDSDFKPLSREDFRSGKYCRSNQRGDIQEFVLDLVSLRRLIYYMFYVWVIALIYMGLTNNAPSRGPLASNEHLASNWTFLGIVGGIGLLAGFVGRMTWSKTVSGLQTNAMHRTARLIFATAAVTLGLTAMQTTVVEALIWMTPERIEPMIRGIGTDSQLFVCFGVVFFILLQSSAANKHGAREFNVYGWRRALGMEAREPRRVIWVWIASFRRTHIGRLVGRFLELLVVPTVSLGLILGGVVFLAWHEVGNWFIQYQTTNARHVSGIKNSPPNLTPSLEHLGTVVFDIAHVADTKIEVHEGHVYSVSIRPDKEAYDWQDASVNMNGIERKSDPGIRTKDETSLHGILSSLKKDRNEPYFRLLGAIGSSIEDTFPIHNDGLFIATKSGNLYLMVNDIPSHFYNNQGKARVTVARLKQQVEGDE